MFITIHSHTSAGVETHHIQFSSVVAQVTARPQDKSGKLALVVPLYFTSLHWASTAVKMQLCVI